MEKPIEDAQAVIDMKQSDGWKVVTARIDEIFARNVFRLIEENDETLRGEIKGIKLFRKVIDSIVSEGKAAAEEAKKQEAAKSKE